MNICNLTELGIGNPSLSVCLIMIYLHKAKTEFLCAAYSLRQYYNSSQMASEKFHYDMRFKKKMFSGTNSSVHILQVPDILNIYLVTTCW